MDNSAITISSIALAASMLALIALGFQIVLLNFRLDVLITDIIPSTIHEEGFSTFLVRLVIVNRASVSRTVCGIKLDLPTGYQKVCSVEPIFRQYKLSGQNEISVTANPMTIGQEAKAQGDSIFQLPLDISPGRSTIQWLALKVFQKCPPQQDCDNMQCQLTLLNVREGVLGKTDVILPINAQAGHVQIN